MKRHLSGWLTILAFFIASNSFSQIIHSLHINFETGKFNLTPEHRKKLDSVAALLVNIPVAYNVNIVGHTDSTGSLKINNTVSLNRANEVSAYLMTKGFSKNKLKVSAKSFFQPLDANSTDKGKSSNRRVTIDISIPEPPNSALTKLKPRNDSYFIQADSGKIIQHSTGTLLLVPPKAFMDEAGNDVTGEVEIRYQEYRTMSDFLLSNVPMSHVSELPDAHFQSSGMFRLEAFQNGQPVYLKKNETIQSSFELTDAPKSLNLYYQDTLQHKWKEVKKLIGQSTRKMKSFQSSDPLLAAKAPVASPGFVAPADTCDAQWLFIKKAKDYCNSNGSLYAILKDSIRIAPVLREIDSCKKRIEVVKLKSKDIQSFYIMKKIKKEQTMYTFELSAHELSKLSNAYVKEINQGKTTEKNDLDELNAYNGIQWMCDTKLNMKFKPTSFKRVWKSCEIIQNGPDYTINLKDSIGTFTIQRAQMFFPEKIKKKAKAAKIVSMQAKYDEDRPSNETARKQVEGEIKWLTNQMDDLENTKDSLLQLDVTKFIDTLKFVWSHTQPHMNDVEKGYAFERWVQYLDSNKALLYERYHLLSNDPFFLSCSNLIGMRSKIKNEFTTLSEKASKESSKMVQQLTLKNLGVFNCASIKVLSNAEELAATYKDKAGKKVEPVITYLVDSQLNGIVTYNGSMGYSPYKFTFSPDDKNALIMIDQNGVAFAAKNDQFMTIKPTSTTESPIKHTFTVEKFDPKDVKALEGVLNSVK